MVDWQKAFSLISSWDHCQRSSPLRISNTPLRRFDPAQNLSSGLVEWSCAVVITTTPRCYNVILNIRCVFELFSKTGLVSTNYWVWYLHAVPFFEKWNAFFSIKNSKNTCCLRGCSILNALNLEKWGVKITKCALSLDYFAFFWL